MKGVAFIPRFNAKGKRDVTGAFEPEANSWSWIHGDCDVVSFNNRMSRKSRRSEVYSALNSHVDLDWVTFFCHGYPRGIQAGYGKRTAHQLATSLSMSCKRNAIVTLFACNAGRDDDRENKDDLMPGPGGHGGFADTLRKEMVRKGMKGGWIDAHTVVGHTTRTPWVRRFYVSEQDLDNGGEYIIRPKSENWRFWRLWLRSSKEFRLSFSLCLASDLEASLSGRQLTLPKMTGGYVGIGKKWDSGRPVPE